MSVAHTFDSPPSGERGQLDRLRGLIAATGTAPITRQADTAGTSVAVPELLAPLFPVGELARGTIVSVAERTPPWPAESAGPSYLTLALAAAASASGAWIGVVGLPALGIAALSGLGANLSRFLMLDFPGKRWADAVHVFAGAVDMVLLRPPARPSGEQLRRIGARMRPGARQTGAVLVVSGPWDTAAVTLSIEAPVWSGLGDGTGNLTGRAVTVAASGRGAFSQQRRVRVMLPDATGALAACTEQVGQQVDRRESAGRRLRIA